jgi:hypothetical protein
VPSPRCRSTGTCGTGGYRFEPVVTGRHDRLELVEATLGCVSGNDPHEHSQRADQLHHAGHDPPARADDAQHSRESPLRLLEGVGQGPAEGDYCVERLVGERREVPHVEQPALDYCAFQPCLAHTTSVRFQLGGRNVAHDDATSHLGQLHRKATRPGANLQDGRALGNVLAQKPAVDLKGDPTAGILVESVPLGIADVIEELPDWIHVRHRPTHSPAGTMSIRLRVQQR